MNKKLFLYLAEMGKKILCFDANKSRKVCSLVPLSFTVSNGNQHLISRR